MNSRGTSTKTRIETSIFTAIPSLGQPIQEAHPLKQGLKQIFSCLFIGAYLDSRGTSTKTRIETWCYDIHIQLKPIQEAHPLKQGLKHCQLFRHKTKSIKFKRHIH